MRNKITIMPGAVYVDYNGTGERLRRIIDIHWGYVFYSIGTEHNRKCKVKTMKRWITANKARNINE